MRITLNHIDCLPNGHCPNHDSLVRGLGGGIVALDLRRGEQVGVINFLGVRQDP